MSKIQRVVSAIALACAIGTLTNVVVLRAQGYPIPAIVNGGALDRRLGVYAQKVLTNAQVLALCTTPVTIIPAQGAGTIIEPIGGLLSYAYTGAYTSVSGNNLKLYYTSRVAGNAATATITMLGFLDQTANKVINFGGVPADEILSINAPIVLENVNGSCYAGGNAANTLTVRVNYIVHNQ